MHSFLIFLSLLFLSLNAQNQQCIILAGSCCPAQTPLTLSCGNFICEPNSGETDNNCPIDCQDQLTRPISFNALTSSCQSSFVFYPSTLQEIKDQLKSSILQNKELRIWGTGHSYSPELCSDGNYMVLKNFSQIHGIENFYGEEVVNVDAGVTFSDLNIFLAQNQKALGFNIPGFGDISVGGFVANDGHGSNGGAEGASIVTLVKSIDKLDQRGRITRHVKACTDHKIWKSLMSDQGLLGITVNVRLKIRDAFNVQASILEFKDDQVFQPGGFKNIADACVNHMFLNWYRDSQTTFVTCGKETTDPVSSPDAFNALVVPNIPASLAIEEFAALQEGCCINDVNHLIEAQRVLLASQKNWIQYTLNNQLIQTDTAIGYSYRMIEATFADYQAHGYNVFPPFNEYEASIPESKIDDAMAYIKSFVIQNDISFPVEGIIVRVSRYNDDSWLGHSAIGEDEDLLGERVYYIETPRFYPFDFSPEQAVAYDEKLIELFSHLVKHFKGKLHTGKNMDGIWTNEEIKKRYKKGVKEMQEFVSEYDPYGIFSNELAADLGVKWPKKGECFSNFYYKP